MKIRVSRKVQGHLEGSHAWQCPEPGYNNEAEIRLMEKIKSAKSRKDGSVVVDLDADERDSLYRHADVMAIGARDNIGPYDSWALADYNAAAALLRQLDKAKDSPAA